MTAGLLGPERLGARLRMFAAEWPGMLALGALTALMLASMVAPVLCTPTVPRAAATCVILPMLQLTFGVAGLAALGATLAAGIAAVACAVLPTFGRAADLLLDAALGVPALLIAIVAAGVLGVGVGTTIVAIMLAQLVAATRGARNIVAREIASPYVRAARGLALSSLRILFVHVVPNGFAAMTMLLLEQLALAVVLETTVSFLGFGLQMDAPSVGVLLGSARDPSGSQLALPAALALVVLLASLHTLRRALARVHRASTGQVRR